ncbi:MAG: AAA family ATPase, partial [Byssovorax sp.]
LSEPSVTFQFRLRLPEGAYVALGDPAFDIAMTLSGGETPYVSAYEIKVEGHEVQWSFDALGSVQSVIVNDKSIDVKGVLSLGGKAHLLPNLMQGIRGNISFHTPPDVFRFQPVEYQTSQDSDAFLLMMLANVLTPLFHGNASEGTIHEVANGALIGKRSLMLQHLASLSGLRQFKQNVDALDLDGDQFEAIASAVAIRLSPFILEAADLVLAQIMSRVSYLAPLRVSAQRAYRTQNLAIDEVDPDGKNLAMFLRALTPAESESFAGFTRAALGFETQIKTTGLHAEILIKGGSAKRFVNLVDVGFGYSEVLPLAAVLWATCIRPATAEGAPSPLVAIEQPELHLHPAHQAKLARMLVEAVSSSRAAGAAAQIIVETHSESLINGLGKLVYEGLIKAEDIQIVLFDQDEETGDTSVRLAGYRENGALHDWPYGFLSPVAERRVPPAAE